MPLRDGSVWDGGGRGLSDALSVSWGEESPSAYGPDRDGCGNLVRPFDGFGTKEDVCGLFVYLHGWVEHGSVTVIESICRNIARLRAMEA